MGKPYSGPVVGEPESSRWGSPGFDCSSLVSWAYSTIGVSLTAFTDAAYGQTYAVDSPLPGDIIFYRYADSGQPGVAIPHMGVTLGGHRTLECRYPDGVGEYHQLATAYEIRRAKGL